MFRRKQSRNYNNMGDELNPRSVYLAAVGMFETAGYVCERVIAPSPSIAPAERARIYSKNGRYRILYYPGKDNDAEPTLAATTLPLKQIINQANQEIAGSLGAANFDAATKYYVIAESNEGRKHFIFVKENADEMYLIDSHGKEGPLQKKYDRSYANSLSNKPFITIHRGFQSFHQTWQCGHHVLQELWADINDKPLKTNRREITKSIVDSHHQHFEKGCNLEAKPLPTESVSFGSDIMNGFFPKKKVSLFTKYPTLKYVIAGALIGLAIVGLVALGVYTFGAGPALLGVGAALGGTFGLSGTAATAVGCGILGVLTVAAGAIAGAVTQYIANKASNRDKLRKFEPCLRVSRARSRSTDLTIADTLNKNPTNSFIAGAPVKSPEDSNFSNVLNDPVPPADTEENHSNGHKPPIPNVK
jgi:hypothetical protein